MFFDIQVNGSFGVDFNDERLSLDAFARACEGLKRIGVVSFFPTVITDSLSEMSSRLTRLVSHVEQLGELRSMVLGLHIEGPFLSPVSGFRGTHSALHVQPANIELAKRLLDAGSGLVRLVTLAPERDEGFRVTRFLTESGIRVFAGHTDASIDCLRGAIDAGLVGFTHLGNGCPLEISRHDNILNRVLSLRDSLYVSLIADGIHIPVWLLRSWIRMIGTERVIITSDAMSAAGMPPGEYSMGGQPILVDDERRTRHRDHSYLAGSASTMNDMKQILLRSGFDDMTAYRIQYENARTLFALESSGAPQIQQAD